MEIGSFIEQKIEKEFFYRALDLIKKSRYILIITHINPDADTISSALALSHFLAESKIKHKVYNVGTNLPLNCDFISKFNKITNQIPKYFDLVISVDCANRDRFGFACNGDIPIINIDHHTSNDYFGEVNIVDEEKSSTAEIVYDFFYYNGLKITKDIATSLYVGIYDDSCAFTMSRCNAMTFDKVNFLVKYGANPVQIADKLIRRDSLAKYRVLPKVLNTLELFDEGRIAVIYAEPLWLESSGAREEDCEAALDMIYNIGIVKKAIFLRKFDKKMRVSLRSKGDIDVSVIANIFGGGGHTSTAGCFLDCDDIIKARDIILEEIIEKRE